MMLWRLGTGAPAHGTPEGGRVYAFLTLLGVVSYGDSDTRPSDAGHRTPGRRSGPTPWPARARPPQRVARLASRVSCGCGSSWADDRAATSARADIAAL